MSRRSNQKLKLLYLSKILLDMTDERHGMTLTQILDELSKYGIETGRKSLYDDMEALRVYGYDVRSKRDRYVRYYINDREFTRADIKLLCDLVDSCGYVGDSVKKELIKKLWQTGYMSGMEMPSIAGQDADDGDAAYKNMELICQAMTNDKSLSFKYFEWNSNKQRKLKNEGRAFAVSPWRLVCGKEGYRLIGFDHNSHSLSEFAVDRMLFLAILNKKREGEGDFLAFRGAGAEQVNLRLDCDNDTATEVFSRFGMGTTILSNKENSFEGAVRTVVNDDFYAWLFARAGRVRVLAPEWVSREYKEMLRNATKGEC